MLITKHLSKILAAGLVIERAHNIIKDLSPIYSQFVQETTKSLKSKLKLRRTVGDKIQEYLKIPKATSSHLLYINEGYLWGFEIPKLIEFEDRYYRLEANDNLMYYSELYDAEILTSNWSSNWSKSNSDIYSDCRRLHGWSVDVPEELRDEEECWRKFLHISCPRLMFGISNEHKCVLYSFTIKQLKENQIKENQILIVNDDSLGYFSNIIDSINNKNKFYNPYRKCIVQLEVNKLLEARSSQSIYQDYVKDNISISIIESEDLRYHNKKVDFDLYTDEIKEFLLDDFLEFIKRQKDLEEKGFDGRRSYLLAGPPGSGKTNIIKSMIRLLPNEYTIVFVSAQAISSLSLLQKAKNVRPIMVVIEDVDLMINEKYEQREVLNFLDGVTSPSNMITVLTANNPETLSSALVDRPGRVDRICYVMPGNLKNRAAQIKTLTKNIKLPGPEEQLAQNSEGLTFAHHREMVRRALIYSKSSDTITVEGWDKASKQCYAQFSNKTWKMPPCT